MLDLTTPIEKLAKVGPKNLPKLKRLGIKTVKDLLWHFPHRYEDYTQEVAIAQAREPGKIVSIKGEIADIKTTPLWKWRRSVTEAIVSDNSDTIRTVWFNQPYIEKSLPIGSLVSLSGKIALDKKGLYLSAPSYEKISKSATSNWQLEAKTHRTVLSYRTVLCYDLVHTGRLVPVYPETEGISSRYLRFLIKPLLVYVENFSDYLPESIRKKYNFPDLAQAVKTVHFPESIEKAEGSKKRIAFDELLLFQIKSLLGRRGLSKLKAPSVAFKPELVKKFVDSLPFVLTNDQRICAFEIMRDFEKKYPMNRLLNGDVGSGKTIVAIIAAYQAANAGFQTVFMAPTEILAQQHYQTIKSLLINLQQKVRGKSVISPTLDPRLFARDSDSNSLAPHFVGPPPRVETFDEQFSSGDMTDLPGLTVGLLTGSEARQWPIDKTENEKVSKKIIQKKISNGEIGIIIGTHAVIQKDVKFKNLGLIVIDEQHRFGIEQRMKLVKNQELTPHLLSMTATPIPRTLALTVYGDLDVSLIKEKPKDRKKIITKVFAKDKSAQVYGFIEKEILSGRQVFVICPRINLSNPQETIKTSEKQNKMNVLWAEVKAVTAEYEKLSQKIFPQLKVAMLHGKMKAKEKEKIMEDFRRCKYDILVSTSVVEVGVDIPNASTMLIENAERFGLAQLHQFRGRVGRAEHQSYCFLVNGGNSRFENKRLKALEISDDGFELAEQDLLLRGPGEFVGTKQSGLPDLAMASLTDLDLIKKARLEAKLLLKEDPNLKGYPLLKSQLASFQKIRHFE